MNFQIRKIRKIRQNVKMFLINFENSNRVFKYSKFANLIIILHAFRFRFRRCKRIKVQYIMNVILFFLDVVNENNANECYDSI